jgi:hypothetical protein
LGLTCFLALLVLVINQTGYNASTNSSTVVHLLLWKHTPCKCLAMLQLFSKLFQVSAVVTT